MARELQKIYEDDKNRCTSLNLPIGKNVLRFIRKGRKKCPKIAVKSPKSKKCNFNFCA